MNEHFGRQQFEMHCRERAKSIYIGNDTVLCRVLGDALMYVDVRDRSFAPHLMMDGFWEAWISVAMHRVLKPGMTAVDVGANYGYYSLLMGRAVGPTGLVYAFEPNPTIVPRLASSLSLSGLDAIARVDKRAAFSTTGEPVRFFIPHGSPMNAAVVSGPSPEDGGEVLTVSTVRLDEALPAKVDFIKIDAEGAEREIWRGLAGTLAANRDIIVFMEFNIERGYDAAEFLSCIERDGFGLACVDFAGRQVSATPADVIGGKLGTEVILHLSRN